MTRETTLLSPQERRRGDCLAIAVVVAFLVIGLVRLYPFENQLAGILSDRGNDWNTYADWGLRVKHGDFFLRFETGVYWAPASFLYIYFVAACFALFGENSVPIYLLQSVLLGLSVALAYWTFRDKMRHSTGLLFLVTAAAFAFLDVTKYYSNRLLGENFVLFTIALFFYYFIRGMDRNKPAMIVTSAAIMGVSVLTRPNFLAFELLLMPLALWHFGRTLPLGRAVRMSLLFGFVLLASTSFLAFRNYVVSGRWVFFPALGTTPGFYGFGDRDEDWTLFETLTHYFRKTAYCFGFLPLYVSEYRYRPHWMVMWAGCLTYFWLRLRSATRYETWQVAVVLFILSHLGVAVLMAPISNYGFRMLIAATNLVLVCAFLALDRLTARQPASVHT